MTAIAWHPTTKQQLERFVASPSHALLLIGPGGSGKTTAALWLISQLSETEESKLLQNPYFRLVSSEGQTIPIEAVRELSQFLKLKTAGKAALRRFVIVEHAEALTPEAQNALLKLLEEPPADTLIVMTLTSLQSVLPTVSSRAQHIMIRRPPKNELKEIFKSEGFEQLYALSDGRPGLLAAMLEQNEGHPLIISVETVKAFLQTTPFERLELIDQLAKQKESLASFIGALHRIASISLEQSAGRHSLKDLERWQKILSASYAASEAIERGGQTKLALTNLALNI